LTDSTLFILGLMMFVMLAAGVMFSVYEVRRVETKVQRASRPVR